MGHNGSEPDEKIALLQKQVAEVASPLVITITINKLTGEARAMTSAVVDDEHDLERIVGGLEVTHKHYETVLLKKGALRDVLEQLEKDRNANSSTSS
jgi:hypothetical protein